LGLVARFFSLCYLTCCKQLCVIAKFLSDLEAAIEHCLGGSCSTVSLKGASIRLKKFENSEALEALLKVNAAVVFIAGGATRDKANGAH